MSSNQTWTDVPPTEEGLYWYWGVYSDYKVLPAEACFGRSIGSLMFGLVGSGPTAFRTSMPGMWMKSTLPHAPDETVSYIIHCDGLQWSTKRPTESGIYLFRSLKNRSKERDVIVITKHSNTCLMRLIDDSYAEAKIEEFNGLWYTVIFKSEEVV